MTDVEDRYVDITLTSRGAGVLLLVVALVLAVAYVVTQLVGIFVIPGEDLRIIRYFDLGAEANLPTYVTALYLLTAGLLVVLLVIDERMRRSELTPYWVGLATIFLYLSLDEATQIHESFADIVASRAGQLEGVWHYSWYIPFLPLLLIVGLLYLNFLRRIPRKYAGLFILSGTIYIGSAVGIEMIQSYIYFHQIEGGLFKFSQLVEETGEMLGVAFFVYALLAYMSDRGTAFRISIRSSESVDVAADRS